MKLRLRKTRHTFRLAAYFFAMIGNFMGTFPRSHPSALLQNVA
jgi:hypothetical protein